LFAEGSGFAGVAFIDGDGLAGNSVGDDETVGAGVTSSPVCGGSAGVGAELAASGRNERVLAYGAGHRDGIVM
jgi:hypothetical protein